MFKFKENIYLKNFTTFRIGGVAKFFYELENLEELPLLLKEIHPLPYFILGKGSNTIFSDKGFNGLIIKMEADNIQIEGTEVKVEAGAILNQVAIKAMELGLSGLEELVGIPGTIGAAIRGNAGVKNKEIGDIVKSIKIFDPVLNKVKTLTKEEAMFKYRESRFKQSGETVLEATLTLTKGDKGKMKEFILNSANLRTKTQPKGFSGGSFFKNPKGYVAGKLIDKAGLKGLIIGDIQVSEKHGNFLINKGNGSFEDLEKVINKIKTTVFNQFGINLEEEIEIVK